MKEIKVEIEILEKLYKMILVTKELIKSFIKKDIKNFKFKDDLTEILNMYNKFLGSIKGMLKNRKKSVKELSVEEKIATYMSVNMNLKNDESNDLANMLKQEVIFNIDEMKKRTWGLFKN